MPKPNDPNKPGFLSAADIAELLGKSERTISNWLRDKHLPFKEERSGRRFVWLDVLEWYVQMRAEEFGNAGNLTPIRAPRISELATDEETGEMEEPKEESFREALTRKTIAEADLKELELATKRAEVVALEDVERRLADVSNALRTKILGWPTRMIGRVFGVKDRNQLFSILTHSSIDLCNELILEGSGEVSGNRPQ